MLRMTWPGKSQHPGPHPSQKVLSLQPRLRDSGGLAAILQLHFLHHQLHSIFRFESLRDELADARREALLILLRRSRAQNMLGALMIAELRGRQPVVGRSRVCIAEKSRQRIIPLALRAGPALEGPMRRPQQLPGRAFFQMTATATAVTSHERSNSRTKNPRPKARLEQYYS